MPLGQPDALGVLAEPNRRKILQSVWDDELSAGEIAGRFDVTFSAISQHLKILRDAGLVVQRKDGRRRLYSANRRALGALGQLLEAYWQHQLEALKPLAEQEQRQRN